MSGGHFDYQDQHAINDIIEILERDIKNNDVTYKEKLYEYDTWSCTERHTYGYQWSPKTIEFIKNTIKNLRKIQTILHEYDYAVEGDSNIEDFEKNIENMKIKNIF